MKQLNRYDFTNDRAFITYLLSQAELDQMDLPECDVIGLRRFKDREGPLMVMRPDEALVLARLLIDAVWQVTEGYTVGEVKDRDLDLRLPISNEQREIVEGWGIPIVPDSTVPQDEIHLRQSGKTEAVLKISESGQCREVWRSGNRTHRNNQ